VYSLYLVVLFYCHFIWFYLTCLNEIKKWRNNFNQQIQHQLQHLANCSRLFINERKFSKIIVTCFFNISSSYFINVVNQFRCYFIIIIYVLFCSYSIASTSSFYRVNTPSWLYHRVTLYFAKTNVWKTFCRRYWERCDVNKPLPAGVPQSTGRHSRQAKRDSRRVTLTGRLSRKDKNWLPVWRKKCGWADPVYNCSRYHAKMHGNYLKAKRSVRQSKT